MNTNATPPTKQREALEALERDAAQLVVEASQVAAERYSFHSSWGSAATAQEARQR